MRRGEQGGSIVGFLVACAVLAVLLIGGVYAVRHAGWFEGASNQGVEVAQNDESDAAKEDGDVPADDEATDEAASEEKTESGEATPPPTSDESTDQNQAAAPSDTNQASDEPTTVPHTGMNHTTQTLPTTGPAETALSLLAVALLAAASTAYVRSMRL